MPRLLVVDKESCIGCGTCVVIAEKTFVLKGDKAEVIIPPGDDEKTIQEAMDSCAVNSISWKEE
ncbi:MAG: ferredoxin [bacterium]|nr:ferredoxin [bacterium]